MLRSCTGARNILNTLVLVVGLAFRTAALRTSVMNGVGTDSSVCPSDTVAGRHWSHPLSSCVCSRALPSSYINMSLSSLHPYWQIRPKMASTEYLSNTTTPFMYCIIALVVALWVLRELIQAVINWCDKPRSKVPIYHVSSHLDQ